MIRRSRHYIRNIGPAQAAFNTVFLGFLVYLLVRGLLQLNNPLQTALGFALLGVPILAGLLTPAMLVGLLVKHALLTAKLIRMLQFVVFVLVAMVVLARSSLPWWSGFLILGVVSLLHGMTFWFYSDSRVQTPRASPEHNATVDRILVREFGTHADKARATLSQYAGPEQERLWLAAIKLAEGQLDQLQAAISLANADYRDVIAPAEYPSSLMLHHDAQEHERTLAEEEDLAQYRAWITKGRASQQPDPLPANAPPSTP